MPGYSDIMLALADEERAYKADMAEMCGNTDDIRSCNSNVQGYEDVKKGLRDEEEGGGSSNVSTEYICSEGQNTIKKSPQRRQGKNV